MSRLFTSGDRNPGHIPIPKPIFWPGARIMLMVDASSRCILQITSHMNHGLAAQKKEISKVTSRCFQWKHRGMDRRWRTKKEPKSVSVGYIVADTRAQRGEEWGNWSQHSLILSLVQGCLRKNRGLCAKSLSLVQLFSTPWTVAHLAPLSMGFSRQEYWSGLLFPSPGDLPDPRIEPVSPASPALAGRFFTTSTTWEATFEAQWK